MTDSISTSYKTFFSLWESTVRDFANQTAIVDHTKAGLVNITYAELDVISKKYAHLFSDLVGPTKTTVFVQTPRSHHAAAIIIAIWRVGAVYCPLSTRTPIDWSASLIDQVENSVIIARGKAEDWGAVSNFMELGTLMQSVENIEVCEHQQLSHEPNQAAYFMKTSGTTSNGNLVSVSHSSFYRMLSYLKGEIHLTDGERHIHTAEFTFSSSMRQLFHPLTRGNSLVVANERDLSDPQSLNNLMSNSKVTILDSTPSRLNSLVLMHSHLELTSNKSSLQTLTTVLIASEPVHKSCLLEFSKLVSRSCEYYHMYGLTETAGIVAVHKLTSTSIGKYETLPLLISGDMVKLEPHKSASSRNDEQREWDLIVTGLTKNDCYVNFNSENSKKYRDCDVTGVREFITGDIFVRGSDDEVYFVGRKDRQVKIMGKRISLEQVESRLSNFGEVEAVTADIEQQKLVAYIRLRNNLKTSPSSFKEKLLSELPTRFIPKDIRLVDRMPITVNGKIDIKTLRAKFNLLNARSDYEIGFESDLIRLWQEHTGMKARSKDDNFFSSGGDSISMLFLLSDLKSHCGVTITPATFVEHPTIEALSAALNDAQNASEGLKVTSTNFQPLTPQQRTTNNFASKVEADIWMAELFKQQCPSPYWMTIVLSCDKNLSTKRLEQVLDCMLENQDIFQTRFSSDTQYNLWVNRAASNSARNILRTSVADQSWLRNLDKSDSCFYVDLDTQNNRLSFHFHHALFDRQSMMIVIEHIATAYARNRKQLFTQPLTGFLKPTTNHVRFAVDEDADFWTSYLTNEVLAGIELFDQSDNYSPSRSTFSIPQQYWSQTKKRIASMGVSHHSYWLMIVSRCLEAVFPRDFWVVGVDFDCRPEGSKEKLIGNYNNQLPVVISRMENDENQSKAIFSEIANIFPHRHMPNGKIREVLSHQSRPAVRSLFQIKLIFQNTLWPRLEFGDIKSDYISTPEGILDTDLVFIVRETLSSPTVSIGFNESSVPFTVIEDLELRLKELLNAEKVEVGS